MTLLFLLFHGQFRINEDRNVSVVAFNVITGKLGLEKGL